jgi:ABC-2 type transport system permease protein
VSAPALALDRTGRASPIRALLLRYLLLLRRDPSRVVDTFYWPLMDVLIWGFITLFIAERGIDLPNAMAVFLGAIVLWNLFFRISQDISVSFLDDVWARSVVTVFASPLRVVEFAAAIMILGLIKVLFTLAAMGAAAWLLYAFNLFEMGWALVPFAANLILMGWSIGLVCMAVILRWGGRWAIIAWSLPFLLMPVSSVFYPESVLPGPARAIAQLVPANHVFEGMRAVVIEGRFDAERLLLATGLNMVYLVGAAALVGWVFRVALRRGLLPKVK